MKQLLITVSAFALLAGPALADSTSTSRAASSAAAIASGGFNGGNVNNFAGSRIPNNTPEVVPPSVSVSGTECQMPGLSIGGAIIGNGAALGLPGGKDDECATLRLAEFYMNVAKTASDPQEARQYRQDAIDLTCQVPRMKALRRCAPAPAPVIVSYSYTQGHWYCDSPAGYYPAVLVCSTWRSVAR